MICEWYEMVNLLGRIREKLKIAMWHPVA